MNLGENIYKLRTARNMSQEDLANALDISRQSVSKWENNSAVPELEKLVKMAQLFGISLDELVTDCKSSKETLDTPAEKVIYIEKAVPSGHSGPRILGATLLVCACLLAILLASVEENYELTEIFLLCLPVAVCGVLCLIAKHPLLWCGWFGSLGYWPYLFILTHKWENQSFFIILGIALVLTALLYTIHQHKVGKVIIPAWLWGLLALGLCGLALLLFVNLLPPASGTPTPVIPEPLP